MKIVVLLSKRISLKLSKRPGYVKQSLIQPTMTMLCREPQKQQTFSNLRNLFTFFQLWNNYIRQSHQNVKITRNLHAIYIF